MQLLKIATAATVKLGPFVDDTDGKTAETGLTISQADIRLSKNGGAFAQTHNAAGATHDENGYYDVPLDATDTGTVGRLRVSVSVAGALPVWQDFMVVPTHVYDSLVLGTDLLDVRADEVNDKTGYSLADGAITAAKIATDAVTKVQAGLSTLTAQDVADAAKLAPSPGDADLGSLKYQVDTCASRASSAAAYSGLVHARLPANPAAVGSAMTLTPEERTAVRMEMETAGGKLALIDAKTTNLPAFPAAVGSPMLLLASERTALAATVRDSILNRVLSGNHEVEGSPGKLLQNADVATSTRSTFDSATDTVIVSTNNDKSGYTLSASGVQAIWEYASRSLTTFGTLVSDIATAVWSAVTRTITGGSLTTSPPTAAQIADAVWDETLADHAGAGSTGAALSGATAPTAAAIADAVWDEAIAEHATAGSTGAALAAAQSAGDPWATELPGAYGSGTAGKIVGNIDSQLESIANRTQIPG